MFIDFFNIEDPFISNFLHYLILFWLFSVLIIGIECMINNILKTCRIFNLSIKEYYFLHKNLGDNLNSLVKITNLLNNKHSIQNYSHELKLLIEYIINNYPNGFKYHKTYLACYEKMNLIIGKIENEIKKEKIHDMQNELQKISHFDVRPN